MTHTHKLLPLICACLFHAAVVTQIGICILACLWYREGETSHYNSSTVYKVVSQMCSTQKYPETWSSVQRIALPLGGFELALSGDRHCQTARVDSCLQEKGRVIYLYWEVFEKLSIYIFTPLVCFWRSYFSKLWDFLQEYGYFAPHRLMQKEVLRLQLLLKHLCLKKFLPNCIQKGPVPDMWTSFSIYWIYWEE